MSLLLTVSLISLIVGPERAVAPPAYGPSYGAQYVEALAAPQDVSAELPAFPRTVMAIWRDYRLSPQGEYSHLQIFGAALDATATTLASTPQPVALSAAAQALPVIAPAGNEALVVWTDLSGTDIGKLVAGALHNRRNEVVHGVRARRAIRACAVTRKR